VCWDLARPGITLGDLAARTEAAVKHAACRIRFLMHGRGLGNDAPMYVFSADELTRRWVLEENACFIIKPVATRDGYADIVWGDSVIVTPSGAQRLGSLPPEIIELARSR
jgi:Xaa-Pro dipeptidase